jgi:5-methyltetrahydrofolate--homocysteine methyltransferase
MQELIDAFIDMREEDTARIARELMDSGTDPLAVLEAARQALEVIGRRFETGEAFIPELLMSGEMMKDISNYARPRIQHDSAQAEKLGKVVMGTVAGDIHNLGKDIATTMLDINGFEVVDLGVDVPPQKFIDKIREVEPDAVGMSGLLTLAFDAMKETVQAIEVAGLRGRVKIMIGGATVDESIRDYVGADAYAPTAMAGVSLVKQWKGIQ